MLHNVLDHTLTPLRVFTNENVRSYLPLLLSIYKLWHSFRILSLGVLIVDSSGFATVRGFLQPDILVECRTGLVHIRNQCGGTKISLHTSRNVKPFSSP